MLLKRKVRVTVTQELFVSLGVRGDARASAWCPRCAAIVRVVTPDEAAAVAGVSTRRIFRWLESNQLHFFETARLSTLVCFESLPRGESQTETGGGETVACATTNKDIEIQKGGST